MSIKTPQTVPPSSGTALEHKKEKNLCSQLNIQLQQQLGVFQASIMKILHSLRDKIKSVKKPKSKAGVDQISTSDPKPGPSQQPDLQKYQSTNHRSTKHLDKPMETDFVGPSLTTTVRPEVRVQDPFGSEL